MENQTLGEYIKERLGDRSVRSLAAYADIGVSTAHKLVNDQVENPDATTLMKVASYLGVPVQTLYELAGYLPDEEEIKSRAIRELEYLAGKLPDKELDKLIEFARVMAKLEEEE